MVNAKNKKIADILTSCSYGVLFSYEDISQILFGKDSGLTERVLDRVNIMKKSALSHRQIHNALVGDQVFTSNMAKKFGRHIAVDQNEAIARVVSGLDEERVNWLFNSMSSLLSNEVKGGGKFRLFLNLPLDWSNPAKALKCVVKNEIIHRFVEIEYKDLGFEKQDRVKDLWVYDLLGVLDIEILSRLMEVERGFRSVGYSHDPYRHYEALVLLLPEGLLSSTDKCSVSALREKFNVMEYERFLARLRVRLNIVVIFGVVKAVMEKILIFLNPVFRPHIQEYFFSMFGCIEEDLKVGVSETDSPLLCFFRVLNGHASAAVDPFTGVAMLWEVNDPETRDEKYYVNMLKNWAAGARPKDTSLQGLVSALAADERFGREWPFLRVKAFEVCNAIYYAFDCLGCPEAYREAVVEVTTSR